MSEIVDHEPIPSDALGKILLQLSFEPSTDQETDLISICERFMADLKLKRSNQWPKPLGMIKKLYTVGLVNLGADMAVFNYTQIIRETLFSKEIKAISRAKPSRSERDAMIRRLCGRGVGQNELAEISGLRKGSIHRIINSAGNRRFRDLKSANPLR